MEKYIWILPLLFVFHDMEEIIGFGKWGRKNAPIMEKKFPKIALIYQKMYNFYSTEGMALAVYEILILCIFLCLGSNLLGCYQLWMGVFVVFLIHLFVHLIQAMIWKGYIPAVLTSIIAIPPSMTVIYESMKVLKYSIGSIIMWSVIAIVLITVNVKIAHRLMHWFTRKYVLHDTI